MICAPSHSGGWWLYYGRGRVWYVLPLIVVAVLWERSGVVCAPSHSGGCMGEVGCDMCSLS